MIKQKRYGRILEIINDQHAVSIDEFCEQLGVSKATIRRDLIYLDAQKLLRRTHGGAISLARPATEDLPISLRNSLHRPEKERIAKAALALLEDGMTVYLGSGSTVRVLASYLDNFTKLTILTNDVGIAYDIAQNTSNGLIVSGGKLEPSTVTLCGALAESTLRDLRVDMAFMSADSVTPQGFMDANIDEVAIKRLMIRNASRTVMLCDHSKFTGEAFMTICPLQDIALTITDTPLAPTLKKPLLEACITLQDN